MPRVTIGVPVYNAESLLEQCLENLAAQTFKDLKVIVLDNASTDATEAVARRFALRDPRFSYRRQSRNVGALQNFDDVLQLADTQYFMWRADDDVADVNFVEEMVSLLDATESAALAVGTVVSEKRGRARVRRFPARRRMEPSHLYISRMLLGSHASWIYGLFRTDALRDSLARVRRGFPHFIGFDHLVLLPFALQERIVGSQGTRFIQRFVERDRPLDWQPPPLGKMLAVRKDFQRYSKTTMRMVKPRVLDRAILAPVLGIHAGRSYRWWRILQTFLRERIRPRRH